MTADPTACFSATYAAARAAFLAAAGAAGAELRSYRHPLAGPDGAPLFLDTARLGAPDAARVLFVASGTHGIEGFAGSGIQTWLLRDGLAARLPADRCAAAASARVVTRLRTTAVARRALAAVRVGLLLVLAASAAGCASQSVRRMEVTAYCGCGECTDWERGSWRYLKLDFWNRYVSKGARQGRPYTGHTASGTMPRQPRPGLFSADSVARPWMLPVRLVLPWLWCARAGTIAADTRYHPFGTRMHVPGWGDGIVEDRGGAIKGPDRLDVYLDSHRAALQWGRRRVAVEIEGR